MVASWVTECHVSVFYHCDLDLVSRIIVSGANLIYKLRQESQTSCMNASLDADKSNIILGLCDLDLTPSF